MNHEWLDGNPMRFILSAPVRLALLLLFGKYLIGIGTATRYDAIINIELGISIVLKKLKYCIVS